MLIKKDFCLRPFNTFGIQVDARKAAVITSVHDLQELYEHGELADQRILILGEGSNILFTDDFEGLVLVNQFRRKRIVEETDDCVLFQVNGGEFWSSLVDYTVEKGWHGLENLSLIPGTVGAAPVQNIGAYGVELKDVMDCLEAFDLTTGKTVQFKNSDCSFTYRSSIFKEEFKNRFFILNVTFRLNKKPAYQLGYGPLKEAFANIEESKITLKQVSECVKSIRRSKLPEPEKLRNAGSFFKNPLVAAEKLEALNRDFPGIPHYKLPGNSFKLPAAWLIEQCGWKGKRVGDAGVYEKQALVLVNHGRAGGKEILALATSIQKSVLEKFGVNLDREVNVF